MSPNVRPRDISLKVPELRRRPLLISSTMATLKMGLSSHDLLTWPTQCPCSQCSPWEVLGSTSSLWVTHRLSTAITQATATSLSPNTGLSSSPVTRCPALPVRLATPTSARRQWVPTAFQAPLPWLLPRQCRAEAPMCHLPHLPLTATSLLQLTSQCRSDRAAVHQASALPLAMLTTRPHTRSATP